MAVVLILGRKFQIARNQATYSSATKTDRAVTRLNKHCMILSTFPDWKHFLSSIFIQGMC